MDNPALKLEEGDLLYKIIKADRPMTEDGPYHKIISKIDKDDNIEGASIFEYPSGRKSVTKFITDKENFDKTISNIIETLESDMGQLADTKISYEVADFTQHKTLKEQMDTIKQQPDAFAQWDETTDTRRRIRIDNPFLLDEE